jgi:hypothetical protein
MLMWRAAGALAAMAILSGCVAAIAPIAAAGVIARKQVKLKSEKISPKRGRPGSAKRGKGRPGKAELLPLKELPPPDPMPLSPFGGFQSYVLAQHQRGVAGEKRDSAVMAPDSTLSRPTVVPCDARPTAVIVDADLRDGGKPLSAALTSVRAGGVKVLWIAGESEMALPEALTDAGFAAGDSILTPQTGKSHKQAVRQFATIDHCIVAIVGRRRGDMDELYDYLRNPDMPVPSDILWNRGWFLIPATPNPNPAPKGIP